MTLTLHPGEIERGREYLSKHRADWSTFPVDVLGVTQWEGQRRLMRAVQKHRRVACKSGHRVSKTHTAASLVLTFLSIYPNNSRVITTANTFTQVEQNLWGEVRRQFHGARVPLGGEMTNHAWKLGPVWEGVGLSTNQPDSFQGKHADHVLVIFDECQDIAREIWRAANTLMSGPDCYWLVIANPTKISGSFFDACHSPDWHVETLSCLDHPNIIANDIVMPGVTPAFVEEYRKLGEDSPEWASRILGEFPESDEFSLITLRMIAQAANPCGITEDAHIGLDVARFGGDRNVLVVTKDRTVIDRIGWTGADLMETTGRAIEAMRKHAVPAQNVHVDVIGIGAGVVDRMREQGHRVDAVNFAEAQKDDWRGIFPRTMLFKNRRAELYWAMRQLMADGAYTLPAEYRDIASDLTAPRYTYDSAGRIQIEAKDDIKERLGRSPDAGDAAVIALARSGGAPFRMRRA